MSKFSRRLEPYKISVDDRKSTETVGFMTNIADASTLQYITLVASASIQ